MVNREYFIISVKPWIISRQSESLLLEEKSSKYLFWEVRSYPLADLTVEFNGSIITPNMPSNQSVWNKRQYTYTFKSVKCEDAGIYSVKAQNNLGHAYGMINVTVFCKYLSFITNLC